MGLGWQVVAAARARTAGGGLKEMLAAADEVRRNMAYYITLDTMEYLGQGRTYRHSHEIPQPCIAYQTADLRQS